MILATQVAAFPPKSEVQQPCARFNKLGERRIVEACTRAMVMALASTRGVLVHDGARIRWGYHLEVWCQEGVLPVYVPTLRLEGKEAAA